jgi:hypothetical protein
VRHVRERQSEQLLLRVPGQLAEAGVHAQEATVQPDDGHTECRVVEGRTEPLLRLAKLVFEAGLRAHR